MLRTTTLGVTLLLGACGKPMDLTPDAAVQVVDAGLPPPAAVCLPDALDGSVDASVPVWDGGLDFSCAGKPIEAGGQAELIISGKTQRAGLTRVPMPGVQVELLSTDGVVLATTQSNDGGEYALRFDAGCQPLNGEVRATVLDNPDAGFTPSWTVPDAPWRRDREGLSLVMFDLSTRGLVAALSGVTIVDGTSALALSVIDCAGNPVQGAVVTTGDAGIVRYATASGIPSEMLTSTGPNGDMIIFNLPGTRVELRATFNGAVISQRSVPIHPNSVSGTFLSP